MTHALITAANPSAASADYSWDRVPEDCSSMAISTKFQICEQSHNQNLSAGYAEVRGGAAHSTVCAD